MLEKHGKFWPMGSFMCGLALSFRLMVPARNSAALKAILEIRETRAIPEIPAQRALAEVCGGRELAHLA